MGTKKGKEDLTLARMISSGWKQYIPSCGRTIVACSRLSSCFIFFGDPDELACPVRRVEAEFVSDDSSSSER